jgi:hypothetical protein
MLVSNLGPEVTDEDLQVRYKAPCGAPVCQKLMEHCRSFLQSMEALLRRSRFFTSRTARPLGRRCVENIFVCTGDITIDLIPV